MQAALHDMHADGDNDNSAIPSHLALSHATKKVLKALPKRAAMRRKVLA